MDAPPELMSGDDLLDYAKASIIVANQPRRGRQRTHQEARQELAMDREIKRREDLWDRQTWAERLADSQAHLDAEIARRITEDAAGQGAATRPL